MSSKRKEKAASASASASSIIVVSLNIDGKKLNIVGGSVHRFSESK